MKERPILFSEPMVRSLVQGRKTQTRRLVKPQPCFDEPLWLDGEGHSGTGWYVCEAEYPEEGSEFYKCPFGQVGDRLWVRETWAHCRKGHIAYREDGAGSCHFDRWRPSIHMPRSASRITLEVTNVRVERLQNISEEDALAEGNLWGTHKDTPPPSKQFQNTWEYLYGRESWDANPWVWVIEFKPAEPA